MLRLAINAMWPRLRRSDSVESVRLPHARLPRLSLGRVPSVERGRVEEHAPTPVRAAQADQVTASRVEVVNAVERVSRPQEQGAALICVGRLINEGRYCFLKLHVSVQLPSTSITNCQLVVLFPVVKL